MIAPGSSVRISGYAPECSEVDILSNALPPEQTFASVNAIAVSAPAGRFETTVTVPAGTAAGSYPLTVRACGGNLGVQLNLTVT